MDTCQACGDAIGVCLEDCRYCATCKEAMDNDESEPTAEEEAFGISDTSEDLRNIERSLGN